jgi:uncharacterized membrane protein
LKKKLKFYLVLLGYFSGMLYGASCQQYRHFDITDPRGTNDSISYINISYGNYNVDIVHKYRFIIPLMARYIRIALRDFIDDKYELDKLSFYIVNFFYSLASSFFLFELLRCIGFGVLLSVIGVSVFISSRITALVTGLPSLILST